MKTISGNINIDESSRDYITGKRETSGKMKKSCFQLWMILSFFAILSPCIFAQESVKIVTTGGRECALSLYTIQNSPFVPLIDIRNLSKDLPSGWKVEWDDTFGILRFSGENTAYSLFLDKKTFLVNDKVFQVKEPIMKQDGRIFIPLSSLEVLKEVFREVSIQKESPIKPSPIPSSPTASPVPEKTTPPTASIPSYPREPSGVFRIMIDPAVESLKWDKPPKSGVPLIKQEIVTLEIALGMKQILEQEKGVEVLLSIKKGETLSPEKRIERINTSEADILVSLRLNASRFENLDGVDIYICSETLDPEASNIKIPDKSAVLPLSLAYIPYQRESLALADSMFKELNSNISCRVGSITPAPLYLHKRIAKPSVLISCGYITNPREASLLTKDTYLETLSRALANGILRYKNEVINKNN